MRAFKIKDICNYMNWSQKYWIYFIRFENTF